MKIIKFQKVLLLTILCSAAFLGSLAYSHCQIPCGIYNDQARLDQIAEHIITIEKSMKQIAELSAEPKTNMNQIVRWVQNKDDHANEIDHIVTYYFMTQRVKPVDKSHATDYEKYIKQLTMLHEMLIYSMKSKQTTELSNVEKLRALLKEFQSAYSEQAPHTH